MKTASLILIAISFMAFSCGSSKTTTNGENSSTVSTQNNTDNTSTATSSENSTTGTTAQNEMTTTTQDQAAKEEQKCRLIISFISIGEGVDPAARDIMDGILRKWESKAGKSITIEPIPWGREGEVDFCFLLNELSAPDQALMAREMREAFIQHPLIQISEFQASMHKR